MSLESKTLWVSSPGLGISLDQKILGVSLKERIRTPASRAGFRVVFGANPYRAGVILPAENVLTPAGYKQLYALASTEKLSPLADIHNAELQKQTFTLRGPADFERLQKWLLQSLVKDSEGFMSRHFERKISLFVTSLLAATPVSPNAMTLVSVGIGVVGSFFFLLGEKWYDVAAALLFWLHSVLDGCDGEIARLKFQESRSGGVLDFWGDNVVHSLVFAALGLTLAQRESSHFPYWLALFAVAGTLLSASLTYWQTMRPKTSAGPLFTSVVANVETQSKVAEVADFLARRDFIYLVIFLAALGQIKWFLWMSAVGSPIYFLVLVYFSLKRKS